MREEIKRPVYSFWHAGGKHGKNYSKNYRTLRTLGPAIERFKFFISQLHGEMLLTEKKRGKMRIFITAAFLARLYP